MLMLYYTKGLCFFKLNCAKVYLQVSVEPLGLPNIITAQLFNQEIHHLNNDAYNYKSTGVLSINWSKFWASSVSHYLSPKSLFSPQVNSVPGVV